MRDRDSAFAVLGLRPGAARAEVDQAYRRLIKRHHPDYAGGDSARAAQINQAYAQLRRPPPPPPRLDPRARTVLPPPRASRAAGWAIALGGLAMAGALFFVASEDFTATDQSWENFAEGSAAVPANRSEAAALARSQDFDEPLSEALIDKSVADALRLHAGGDTSEMADFSRACIAQLRKNPTWARFDSCAAYDEAVGILETASAGFDSGAFNPSAVTARQVGAARLLSPDYLTAESRLQQIRSRVHLTLLPRIPDSGSIAQAPLPEPSRTVRASRESPRAAFRPSFPIQQPAPTPPRPSVAAQATAAPRTRAAVTASPPRTKQTSPPPAAAPASREVPAWQKPLSPSWQRPLTDPKPAS